MKGFSTISAILSDVWFIDPRFAHAHQDFVLALLEGRQTPTLQQGQGDQPKPASISSRDRVGVITIAGPVTKYDGFCGEPGYLSYGEQLTALIMDDGIDTILIVMDCPGGQGAGLRTFAHQVRNSTKPVIGFVNDGMACSAGYWILAACSWIIASQPTDRTGSIGAFTVLRNYIKASENAGVPLIEIYSSLSSEKNLSFREALDGKPELMIAELDELVTVYHNDVKDWRGGLLNLNVADPFKGGDFPAQSPTGIDALSIGLIDEIGTIDLAFQRANEVVSNPNLFTDMSKFTRLNNLIGKPADQVTPATLSLINAELTEAGITAFGVHPESLVTEAAQLTTDLKTANDRIAELEALPKADELTTQVNNLTAELGTAKTELSTAQQLAKDNGEKVNSLTTELDAAKIELATLKGEKPAGGNLGKKPKSEGDQTQEPPKKLHSWDLKAQQFGRK